MRRISGPRGWLRRGRSARGTAELSVVVVAGSLLAGLVFGNGLARTSLDLTDGLSWLKDEPSGQVLQVNPLTGEPMGALDTGDPNDPLQLAQYDGGLVVLNRATGTLTSFDLATILQTGQSRVRDGDQVELLVHDEQFFRLDKQEGTFAALDAVTTRPIGEIWFSPTGLVDAKIDEEGTIWTLDPEGLVTALTWSPESRSFIVEDTRKVDHSGPGSVLVAHQKGVTLFGPDNGIVVQVGTGRDIVHGGINLKGRLAGPGVSPDDLVPVSSPENGTVVIVSGDRVVQVPLGGTCEDPGAPLAYHDSVYVPCEGDAQVLRLSPDGKVVGAIRTPREGRGIELVLDDGYLLINVQGADTGIRVLPNGDTKTFTRRERGTPVRSGRNDDGYPDLQQNAAQDRDEGRDREPPPPLQLSTPPIKLLPPPEGGRDHGGKDPGRTPGKGDHEGLAAPSSVVATVEGGRVVLRWSHSGRPAARSFEVREAGGGRVATLRDGERRELRLDGGVPTTPTAWTVTAINGRERAVSAPSNEIPDDGAPAELAAPVSVLATAEPGGKVRLSWAHGGEVAADHFRVERSGGVVLAQDLAADDRDYVDEGAPLGKPVTYVVTAIRGKERAASAASNPVTPAEAPAPLAAPASVVATPLGDGTVHLTWTHTGSTPAGQFTVATGGGADVTPSAGVAGGAREATVSAPVGTPVTFVVTAVNGEQRVASTPSNEVTPARDPDPVSAPTGVTATAQSNGTVRVTWTHTGTAAAEFVVNGGGREVARVNGTEREAVVSGIAPGSPVTFTVTAVLGSQTRTSAASNAVTTSSQPGAPPNVRVSAEPTSTIKIYRVKVTVTWGTAPDNGSPITGYAVTIGGGGLGERTVQATADQRSASATFGCNYLDDSCGSLGEDFVATVTATNAFGTGPAGSNQTDVPPPPQPGAPANVRASGDFQRTGSPLYADGTCTLSVTWGAAPDNGYPIEGYDVTFGEGASAITRSTGGGGRDASATKDCEAGNGAQDFTVTVRARNSSATGPAASATGTLSTGGRWTCWPDPRSAPASSAADPPTTRRKATPVTATIPATAPTPQDIADFRALHQRVGDAIETAVHGKRPIVNLVLVATFTGGHVLLEDVPGTGKTTLARATAQALGGTVRRIQFTPDLLPGDVTGTTIFDPRDGAVRFRPGPVFANVLLADEINRAAAKTQSALLEVMEEHTVTVDGEAHPVPAPFVVIATQNPVDLDGTYQLPEAQLDRFLIRTALGYPDIEHELDVLRPGSTAGVIGQVAAVTTPAKVADRMARLRHLHVADPILRYVREIGAASRKDPRVRLGASTRGLRALVRCLQVYAAAQGRHYVIPHDVQRLAEPVLAHRIVLSREAALGGHTPDAVLHDVLQTVEPPQPDRG